MDAQQLYEQARAKFNLPEYETFIADMQDETKRRKAFEGLSASGLLTDDFDTFSSGLIKKKA